MGIVANCFVADNNMILRSGDLIGLPALDKPIQFLSEISENERSVSPLR